MDLEKRIIPIESVTPEQEAAVHEELGRLATKHATVLFEVLPYDPDTYDFQRLAVTHQKATPQSIEEVRAYGNLAYPHFDACVDAWKERPDLLKTHRLLTDSLGLNVYTCTDHSSNIIDVAIAGGSQHVAINEAGRARKNHIVVSKIVTRLGAFGVPAVNILQAMSNVWFSFPTTESVRQSAIDPAIAFACNQAMKADLQPTLDQGGNSIAEAPPGRTGTIKRDRQGHIKKVTIHGLGTGTSRMLEGNVVEPVYTWMDTDNPLFEIGFPYRLHNEDEVHDFMQGFATRLQGHLQVEVEYERERSLLSRLSGALRKEDIY